MIFVTIQGRERNACLHEGASVLGQYFGARDSGGVLGEISKNNGRLSGFRHSVYSSRYRQREQIPVEVEGEGTG